MTFTDYAAKKGIQLLKDDMAWLRGQIDGLPKAEIQELLREYVDVWLASMALCENDVRKQNEGRAAANKFLRERLHARYGQMVQ